MQDLTLYAYTIRLLV